jgi:acylphosphatase
MSGSPSDRDLVRAELVISGRVQGVFFRGSAQAEGLRLGICGEVGNIPDGGVEATVEGERRAVEEFIAWCRKGPPAATVESVQVKFSPVRGEFRTFRVGR